MTNFVFEKIGVNKELKNTSDILGKMFIWKNNIYVVAKLNNKIISSINIGTYNRYYKGVDAINLATQELTPIKFGTKVTFVELTY